MPQGSGPPGGATNPNNPYVAGSQLSPQIVAMLQAGNFNGAFQSAMQQNTADMPGMSQLQQLLSPSALQASGVTWSPETMNAYYTALNQNGAAIAKNDNEVLKSLGNQYNPQIASGNGGNSQFLNGTFGSSVPTAANGNYVPNPIAQDFTPKFQNGHMGGALGDIANATEDVQKTVGPILIAAGLAYAGGMGAGALAGGAGAGAGSLGAGIATGAGAGAVGTAATDVMNNRPLTLGSVGKGAALGAISGGIGSQATGATSALTNAGINPTVANALVKGTIGAGVGALGNKLSGGSPGNGAIVGGLGGAAAGALGSATGSPTLGTVGGTIAGNLANKYLTSPSTTAAPPTVAPKPLTPGALPGTSTASGGIGMPTLPAIQGNTPAGSPTNIGSYSGYGYQPRQQINPNINYATYGQGPEAQFFKNVGAPVQNTPLPAGGSPLPVSNSLPPMATVSQGNTGSPLQHQ